MRDVAVGQHGVGADGMKPPLLELTNAVAVLGGTRVLDGLTLTIGDGEHTAILGPNGAGKSTLVKLLALEHYPLAGHSGTEPIRVFGKARWDVFQLRSRLGIVSADLHDRFVRGNANGRLTGLDAVVSGFVGTQGTFAHQRVTDEMRLRAARALDRIDASRLSGQTLNSMSTGEARRVLIARALVHEPAALVLDEPTRGLDLVSRHQFMERIRLLAGDGTTVLLITHHVDEIIPEIDRVILLREGRVVSDGAKADVLNTRDLSDAFGARVAVDQVEGYYYARCG